MLFNPTQRVLTETIALPLYYTGLTGDVMVALNGATPIRMTLERDYALLLRVVMVPVSVNTVVLTTV